MIIIIMILYDHTVTKKVLVVRFNRCLICLFHSLLTDEVLNTVGCTLKYKLKKKEHTKEIFYMKFFVNIFG